MKPDNEPLIVLLSLLSSFIIVYIIIPTIVRISRMKNLVAVPNQRTVHKRIIPTLGGVAIFAGLLMSIILWSNVNSFPNLQYIIGAIIIIFFIGLKDDIVIIAPMTKLIGQIVSALMVVLWGNIQITHLHGFSGIHEISQLVSIPLTIFVMLVIINGFNLVDGIDGLASGIGILNASFFGIWFFLRLDYQYAILSFSLVGALLAFFWYNVFGKKNKIFMGDTGSLIIGLIISILVIQFNQSNIYTDYNYPFLAITSAPSVSFGILIIPLFDTLRIMFIRLFTVKPLFKPDKRHLHHRLLELGLTHIQATAIILSVNLFFIAFSLCFSYVSIRRLLLMIVLLAMLLSYIPTIILAQQKKRIK